MNKQLKKQIAILPTIRLGNEIYLSYQAVTDTVAAFLFPNLQPDQIDETGYQQVLETADILCRESGYTEVVKLTPPEVSLSEMGLYWTAVPQAAEESLPIIHTGPDRAQLMAEGLLLDAGPATGAALSQLGLDEVTRQHFKIPVTASEAVLDLLHQAVASDWPNDYRGIWHDILGMCIAGGQDTGSNERTFAVIIRGLGRRRYWQFTAVLKADNMGDPFLYISLADEEKTEPALFELGQVVMTPGAAALGVNLAPYLARHASGDWGELEAFDIQQNNTAVKEGYRILSAYEVPLGGGTERIWIITEADVRHVTVCGIAPKDATGHSFKTCDLNLLT